MKVEELRIGNIVDCDGMSSRVASVHNAAISITGKGYVGTDHIKPMKIDSSLSNLFGNINSELVLYVEMCAGVAVAFIKNTGKPKQYLCVVKYVHQFQNLYFALTGKELEI